MKPQKIIIIASVIALSVFSFSFAVDNTQVRGHKKPEVCLKTNIRCILKKQAGTLYWCLKSNQQRNLDARRTTSPIKKTRNEILGHCAKIIPIRE